MGATRTGATPSGRSSSNASPTPAATPVDAVSPVLSSADLLSLPTRESELGCRAQPALPNHADS